jgi:hypothetical protein
MGRIVWAAFGLVVGAWSQTPTGILTGTVIDITTAGIPRAKIVIAGLSSRTEATDNQGKFHIAGLEPGQYQLSITVAGFHPKQVSGRVEANQTTALGEINMEIAGNVACDAWIMPPPTVVVSKREHRQHGILIAGTVRDWGKSPIARAIVRLRIFQERDAPEAVVKTDRAGGFEFTGLMPGTYVLSVEADSYDPVRIRQIIVRSGFEVHIDDILMGGNVQICL